MSKKKKEKGQRPGHAYKGLTQKTNLPPKPGTALVHKRKGGRKGKKRKRDLGKSHIKLSDAKPRKH